MTHNTTPLRGSRRSALALLTLLIQIPASAEEDKVAPKTDPIEPLIVSALRIPQDASTVTSAVTVLDPVELQNQGITQLRDALNQSPGVIATSTAGQSGAPGNLFIRGTTTKYAQVVIDGMRLSDSNNQLNNVLGGTNTYGLGSIEVLRGPQGAIYGGESIGGVIWMETPYGSGAPHGATTFEAGSFQSIAASSMFQGQSGDLTYHLSGGYQDTDNDAPHHAFHLADTALRVEGKIDSIWTIGTTFRATDSSGEDLDTSYSYDGESHVDSALSTLYAVGKISSAWTARFHAGYYQESYDQGYTYDDWFSGLALRDTYFSDLRVGTLSTDHEITLANNLRLLAGAFVHKDTYESTYSPDKKGERYGVHSTLEWDAIENLITSVSLRWEDYDAYGDELSWKLGTLYHITTTGTTLRANLGSSFRAPTYAEVYGSAFNPPSTGLDAESSIGWDLGVEQKLGNRHTLEVTWFDNQISDQIAYSSYASAAANITGNTTTDGLEIGLRGDWLDNTLNYRLAWTYLHQSLSDQPKHAATASLAWKPTDKALIGIGATHLADRTWGGDPIDAYTVARLFGSYQITDSVKLHARLENALDEDYELYSGYGNTVKGAGTGLYAGLTIDW